MAPPKMKTQREVGVSQKLMRFGCNGLGIRKYQVVYNIWFSNAHLIQINYISLYEMLWAICYLRTVLKKHEKHP